MTQPTVGADPKLHDALDAWENQWFPMASASLRFRFPAAHAWLFEDLRRTDGLEVVLSVGTFLRRVEQLPGSGVEGAEDALGVLRARGLTEAVLRGARDLLVEVGRGGPRAAHEQGVEPERKEGP